MTRRHHAAVAIGMGLPLIWSQAAIADVTLLAVGKDTTGYEEFVSYVVNVYAVFDGSDTATNFLTGVGGLPGEEGHVGTFDGVFFQSPLNTNGGGSLAPSFVFFPTFPELAVDSFVTIGAKATGSPTVPDDQTGLTSDFNIANPWTETRLTINDGAWFVTPEQSQGHVGNNDNLADAVLIGQFSVAAGAQYGVFGQLRVQGVNEGQAFTTLSSFSFAHPLPSPASAGTLCVAGVFGARGRRRTDRDRRRR